MRIDGDGVGAMDALEFAHPGFDEQSAAAVAGIDVQPQVMPFTKIGDATDVINRASTRRSAVGNDYKRKMPRLTILRDPDDKPTDLIAVPLVGTIPAGGDCSTTACG